MNHREKTEMLSVAMFLHDIDNLLTVKTGKNKIKNKQKTGVKQVKMRFILSSGVKRVLTVK